MFDFLKNYSFGTFSICLQLQSLESLAALEMSKNEIQEPKVSPSMREFIAVKCNLYRCRHKLSAHFVRFYVLDSMMNTDLTSY